MDMESETIFMQNLEEYIFDENKVVTCRWLSSTFSINVDIVRKLVEKFTKVKNDKGNLKKTYYVSGILKNGKGLISTIIREDDIISLKDKLDVVYSEHLYSIQKDGVLKDLALLYVANQHDDCYKGIIKNNSVLKRSENELAGLRLGTYPKAPASKPVSNQSNSKPPSIFSNNKTAPVKTEPNIQKNEESRNVNVKKEIVEETPKTSVNSNKTVKRPAGIAGFFSKQAKPENVKVEKKSTQNSVDPIVKKEKLSPVKTIIKEEKSTLVKIAEKEYSTKKTENSGQTDKGKSSKGVSKKKESVKKDVGKKRKRIQAVESDSEEETKEVDVDDIFSSNSPEHIEKPELSDDEDVIPPTPEMKVNKAPLNPRKRKKVVDKTFMDENGFFVTKKEEVYESCSDNDNEQDHKIENVAVNNIKSEPKQLNNTASSSPVKGGKAESKTQNKKTSSGSPTKGGKKKASPRVQGKQQSLMSFFKKAEK